MGDFKHAKISKGQQWYIYWYEEDPKCPGKFKRKKDTGEGQPYGSLNRIASKREREKEAQRLCATFNGLLQQGWRRDSALMEPEKKDQFEVPHTLQEAVDEIGPRLDRILKPKPCRVYKGIFKKFQKYAEENGCTTAKDVTRKLVVKYLDAGTKTNKTYNNHLMVIRTHFREMIELEIVEENPAATIKLRKVTRKKFRRYTVEQLAEIQDYFRQNEPMTYIYFQLLLYCWFHPQEMRQMRVGDIDFEYGFICIGAWESKNNREKPVFLPSFILKELKEYAGKAPSHYYLFGTGEGTVKNRKPAEQMTRNNFFRDRWTLMREKLGLPEDLKPYGLKHTGMTRARRILDPAFIKDHARHSSLDQTYQYTEDYYVDEADRSLLERMNEWEKEMAGLRVAS